MQARQIGRQRAQLVARKIEDFQRVGQAEDGLGKLPQVGRQVQAGDAGQIAALELLQGVHGGVLAGWLCFARSERL